MKTLNNMELNEISGGIKFSASLLNYGARVITALLDLGRAFGSALRRIGSGRLCPI